MNELRRLALELNRLGLIEFADMLIRLIDYYTGVKDSIEDYEFIDSFSSQSLYDHIVNLNTLQISNFNEIRECLIQVSETISNIPEIDNIKFVEMIEDVIGIESKQEDPIDPESTEPEEPELPEPTEPEEPELPEPLQLPDRPVCNVPDGWVDLGLKSGNLWATNYLRTNNHSDIALNDIEYFCLGEPYSKTKCGRNQFTRVTPVKFGSNIRVVDYSYYEDDNSVFKRSGATSEKYNASTDYIEEYASSGFNDDFLSFSNIIAKGLFNSEALGKYTVKKNMMQRQLY